MRKITKEEMGKLAFKKNSPIIRACLKLGLDESLMVEKDDYIYKSPINQYIGTAQNDKDGLLYKAGIRLKVQTLLNDFGWVITRIK